VVGLILWLITWRMAGGSLKASLAEAREKPAKRGKAEKSQPALWSIRPNDHDHVACQERFIDQFLATRSPALREELVLSYVSLVHYVMGKLPVAGERQRLRRLVHQGLLGLIEAVDRFDPSYGTQFSTYATVRIRGKVLDYLRSLDWLSRTARHRSREVQQAITTLTEENQRPPSDEEIAEHLAWT
jgi:DNA-directed RNA polymerase specialized sigma subunit